MPVGRIEYMYLEPLSFEEFLLAQKKYELARSLNTFTWDSEIPVFIHEKLMMLFKEYVIVGGMPEAVVHWVENHSLQGIGKVHRNLITTYRDDFGKYSGRISAESLDDVLAYVPKSLGKKFVYRSASQTAQISAIKSGMNLLGKARVCHKVKKTAANGVPLGAESHDAFLRVILLDVGLCSAILDISLHQLQEVAELELINKGGIAEQVVGQLLRTIRPFYQDPSLYYWMRPEKKASAEVDYVIQHKGAIVPVEVKAGSTGRLKSLHLFMGLKKLPLAVRINGEPPLKSKIHTKDHQGQSIKYELTSIPFYLIGELPRLMG